MAEERLFETEERDGIGIVRFLDRIELYEAGRIRTDITEWIDSSKVRGIVFSFADVPYVDSSGVGVFVSLQYRLANHIPIRLCRLSETVRDVLAFTNLVSVFVIDETEEESIANIRLQIGAE